MRRYFLKRKGLALVALISSILFPLTVPVSALIEQRMIDEIIAGDLEKFKSLLIIAGAILLVTTAITYLSALAQKSFKTKFQEDLRNDLFQAIIRKPPLDFEEVDTGEYLSIITSQSSTVANNFTQPVFYLISYGLVVVFCLLTMLYFDVLLAIIALVSAILSAIPAILYNRRLAKDITSKAVDDAKLSFNLKEALNAHNLISSTKIYELIEQRFQVANEKTSQSGLKLEMTISQLENVAKISQKVAWFLAFLAAGTLAVKAQISIGTLVMFITLFATLNNCVTFYAQLLPLLMGSRPLVKDLLAIIDECKDDFTGEIVPSMRQSIEFKDLRFAYPDGTVIFNQFNFAINRGDKITITGASGSGKSTLVELLIATYPNYEGLICYDGVDLKELKIDDLPHLVSLIHQDSFIFNDSIRFNILLGEEYSEDEIKEVLEISGINYFLDEFTDGLDTPCGENGSLLSGGQIQRIAIARALIRKVPVLILDEALSAVDLATAHEIEKKLLSIKDLTLISITHRSKDSLNELYDSVFRLVDGQLVKETEFLFL